MIKVVAFVNKIQEMFKEAAIKTKSCKGGETGCVDSNQDESEGDSMGNED